MRQWRKLAVPVAGLAAVAWAGIASASQVDVPGDHYLCYKVAVAKIPLNNPLIGKPVKGNIHLIDQFEDKFYDALKITEVCNPADKDVTGDPFPPHLRVHPNVHQMAYQIKNVVGGTENTSYPTVHHIFSNQFQMHDFTSTKPDSLLVRSQKINLGVTTKCKPPDTLNVCPPLGGNCANTGGGSPCACDAVAKICLPTPLPNPNNPPTVASGVNNFKCYKVKDAKNPIFVPLTSVIVTDQFGTANYDISKITKECNPVDKDGEGYVGSQNDPHLVCYKAARSKVPVQPKFLLHKVMTANVNIGKANLDVKAIAELCVPSCKDNITCGQATTTTTTVTTTTATTTTTTTATTTTVTTTSTTTTTLACTPPVRITTQSTGHCSVTIATTCFDNSGCPGGETCLSGGTLTVDSLPSFTFPLGVLTTVDAGTADANCKHPAIIQAGNFSVPIFFINALNYCSQVTNNGCAAGGADGNGNVWDATAPPATVLASIKLSTDTADGTCDTATQCSQSAGTCTLDATWPCGVLADCTTNKRCSNDHSLTGKACTSALIAGGCFKCNSGVVGKFCTSDTTNAVTGCGALATCPGCCTNAAALTCDTLATKGTCDLTKPGAGKNTLANTIITRTAAGTAGVHTQINVPVHSVTWQESTPFHCNGTGTGCNVDSTCTALFAGLSCDLNQPQGIFAGTCTCSGVSNGCPGGQVCDQLSACNTGFDPNTAPVDLAITTFDFVLRPSSGVATAEWANQNADTCFFSGSGPAGPTSLTGSPAAGPGCTVGQATTVVSVGTAPSGGPPLFDLTFSSTIPTQITACGAFVPGSCTLTTNPCDGL